MEESSPEVKLTLGDAKEDFLKILRGLNDEGELRKLLSWIHWNWLNSCTPPSQRGNNPDNILAAIAADIRRKVPLSAILPSEVIRAPLTGKNSDCDPQHTIHVDAFLYDDDMVDKLCEEDKFPRNYCVQCDSAETKPMTYISHSASRERLKYIFNNLLQPIDGKIVLDIGSRLGAVLYAACAYTKAARIIGIEMNTELCKIQQETINHYSYQGRVEVVEGNVMDHADVVNAADVIIMNNVFEFFLEPEQEVAVWCFLRETIKKGTVLVTIPPLDVTFSNHKTGINLSEWVQELAAYTGDVPGGAAIPETEEVKQYLVL